MRSQRRNTTVAGDRLVIEVGGQVSTAGGTRWRAAGTGTGAPLYRRCSNLDTAAACNWLVAPDDAQAGEPPLCRCCRLTRTLPAWWR